MNKIYINKDNEIKAINSTDDTSLIEIEVNREEVFGDKSDFMILNYCYKQDENGYSIYPASDYSKLVEEDYRIKVDESQKKISILEAENVQRDEEALVGMLALVELFEIVISVIPYQIDSLKNTEIVSNISKTYKILIDKKIKKIEDIPYIVKSEVELLLEEA